MDDKLIAEFEMLKSRLRKAEEYERTKYKADTHENQERALKTSAQVAKKMAEIWNQMSLTIELNPDGTKNEWESEIEKYSEQFLYPARLKCLKKSQRVFVRLEPPLFWWNTITKIINE